MRFKRPSVRYAKTPEPVTPYQKAAQVWDERLGSARVQARNWRLDGHRVPRHHRHLRSRAGLAIHPRRNRPLCGRGRPARGCASRRPRHRQLPPDRSADRLPPGALHRRMSARFPPIRSCSARTGSGLRLHHRSWLRRAQRLRPRERPLRPRRRGPSPPPKSPAFSGLLTTAFRVAWTERRYVNGQLSSTERWTGILSVVVQPPRDADRLRKNPLASSSTPSTGQGSPPNDRLRRAFWRLTPTVIAAASLSACATFKPPEISYDDPVAATLVAEPARACSDRRDT